MVDEIQTQARPTRRFAVTFVACFFVGMAGTALLVHYKSAAPTPDESSATVEPGPASILLHQIRQLSEKGSEQELALRTSLGHIYRDQGRYAEAVKHYTSAHDIAVQLGGGEGLIAALQSRGSAQLYQGRLASARRDLETAYVLVDKERDPEQAIAVLHRLADVRRDSGHLSSALELYGQAVKLASERLKEDEAQLSHELAGLLTDMGEVHARRGEVAEALSLFRQAFKHCEKGGRSGAMSRAVVEDPQSAVTQSLYGSALHMRGDASKGMESYHKALRQQARTLRPDHPDLAFTRMSIARAQRDLGDTAKALETLNAVESTVRGGAQEGPDLSRTLVIKADLLRELKRFPEAKEAMDEAFKQQGKAFGDEDNPEAAVALNGYGSILHDEGKLNDALTMYLRALEVNTRTVGMEHPETAATHNSLGTLYQDAGDDVSAQKHFEKCLEIQLSTVGTASPDIATSYNNIATILYRRGKLEDAARLLAKALAVLDQAGVPEGNPDRAVYRENLQEVVQLIHKKGKEKESESATSKARTSVMQVQSQGPLVRRETVV